VLLLFQKRILQMLVSKLTNDYKYYENSAVKATKNIAVLSQYRAQVSALETELKVEGGFEQCTVSTVVASQGWLNQHVFYHFLSLALTYCIDRLQGLQGREPGCRRQKLKAFY